MEIYDNPGVETMRVTDCIIEGSILISKQGSVLYASSGAAGLLGYNENAMLAISDSLEFVYAPDRFVYTLLLAETRSATENNNRGVDMRLLHFNGSIQTYFCTFRKIADGSTVCLNLKSVNPVPLHDDVVKLVGLYDCARDILQGIRNQKDQAGILKEAVMVATGSGIFEKIWISAAKIERHITHNRR